MTSAAIPVAPVSASMVVETFNLLGGDCSKAVRRAKAVHSLGRWKAWQALQAATVGGVAVAAPGAHVPLTLVDLIYLLHKMAYCCWGIGAILGCDIQSKEDFAVILAMYVGEVTEDTLTASVGAGALLLSGNAIVNMGLPTFISKVTSVGAGNAVGQMAAKLSGKVVGKALAATSPIIAHISGKLAAKFASKMAAKLAIKGAIKGASNLVAGLVPVAGIAIGAGVNIYFVTKIAKTAETYYGIKSKATRSS